MAEVSVGHAIHLQAVGPVIYSTFEIRTVDVNGPYLDFFYACIKHKDEGVALTFLPSGHVDKVLIGPNGKRVRFEPTIDETLMRELVTKEYGPTLNLPTINRP